MFFFNDTATTEIYTLSLHDALPILLFQDFVQYFLTVRENVGVGRPERLAEPGAVEGAAESAGAAAFIRDRKSTRLNPSHANISYAVFCLKKKKTHANTVVQSTTLID